MLCAKFGWNWPVCSREDKNVKSLQIKRRITAISKASCICLLSNGNAIIRCHKRYWADNTWDEFQQLNPDLCTHDMKKVAILLPIWWLSYKRSKDLEQSTSGLKANGPMGAKHNKHLFPVGYDL